MEISGNLTAIEVRIVAEFVRRLGTEPEYYADYEVRRRAREARALLDFMAVAFGMHKLKG